MIIFISNYLGTNYMSQTLNLQPTLVNNKSFSSETSKYSWNDTEKQHIY